MIERFREEYGEDPRDCPDDDPRFWRVLSIFVTQFARELRGAVDAMSDKMGRKLEIAYNITSTMESRLRAPGVNPASRLEVAGGTGKYNLSEVMQSNMVWGVDVETLVKEGLVDYLMPHPTFATNAGRMDSTNGRISKEYTGEIVSRPLSPPSTSSCLPLLRTNLI